MLTKTAQLHDLETTAKAEPAQDIDLLDGLPILDDIAITQAPEVVQRKLYDAFQLQIHYDRPDQARFRLVLTDDTADALTTATTGGTVTDLAMTRAHKDRTPPGAPSIKPLPTSRNGAATCGCAGPRRRCRGPAIPGVLRP